MNQSERRQYLIRELISEEPEYKNIVAPRDAGGQKTLLRALMNVREPRACSEEFLKVQDAYLQAETEAKGITDLADLTPAQDGLYIWQAGAYFRQPSNPNNSSYSSTHSSPTATPAPD